jgi:hypothetical protein
MGVQAAVAPASCSNTAVLCFMSSVACRRTPTQPLSTRPTSMTSLSTAWRGRRRCLQRSTSAARIVCHVGRGRRPRLASSQRCAVLSHAGLGMHHAAGLRLRSRDSAVRLPRRDSAGQRGSTRAPYSRCCPAYRMLLLSAMPRRLPRAFQTLRLTDTMPLATGGPVSVCVSALPCVVALHALVGSTQWGCRATHPEGDRPAV